eukprot:6196545-Pleurochrysis_carterae.AAC.1
MEGRSCTGRGRRTKKTKGVRAGRRAQPCGGGTGRCGRVVYQVRESVRAGEAGCKKAKRRGIGERASQRARVAERGMKAQK